MKKALALMFSLMLGAAVMGCAKKGDVKPTPTPAAEPAATPAPAPEAAPSSVPPN